MDNSLYLPQHLARLPDSALMSTWTECRDLLIPLQGYLSPEEARERDEIEEAILAVEHELAGRKGYHAA